VAGGAGTRAPCEELFLAGTWQHQKKGSSWGEALRLSRPWNNYWPSKKNQSMEK